MVNYLKAGAICIYPHVSSAWYLLNVQYMPLDRYILIKTGNRGLINVTQTVSLANVPDQGDLKIL